MILSVLAPEFCTDSITNANKTRKIPIVLAHTSELTVLALVLTLKLTLLLLTLIILPLKLVLIIVKLKN